MDQQIFQNILLAIIAIEGAVIAYTLFVSSGSITPPKMKKEQTQPENLQAMAAIAPAAAPPTIGTDTTGKKRRRSFSVTVVGDASAKPGTDN